MILEIATPRAAVRVRPLWVETTHSPCGRPDDATCAMAGKSRTRRNKAGAGQISHIVFRVLLGNSATRDQLPATVNARYHIGGHLRAQTRVLKR
jgi:hypothetical protein